MDGDYDIIIYYLYIIIYIIINNNKYNNKIWLIFVFKFITKGIAKITFKKVLYGGERLPKPYGLEGIYITLQIYVSWIVRLARWQQK